MNHKLALLTPLHPQKTGISDYIEEMLPYIRGKFGPEYQIDIYVDDCVPVEKDTISHHRIMDIDDYEEYCSSYDLTIYQMGNSRFHLKIYQMALKHPGIVILHDYAIHHMVAELYLDVLKDRTAYFDEVGFNHGEMAKTLAYQRMAKGELGLWETDAFDYPMTRRLIQSSSGVVVFSQMVKDRLKAYGTSVPIHRVYLHCGGPVKECSIKERNSARRLLDLHIADDEILIGTFGFIGESKRPYSILNAVRRLRAAGEKVRLVYVGELQERCRDLSEKIKKMGLTPYVTVTGFTNSEDFLTYLKACDINLSLRNPTMGENSGPLFRAFSMGKPSVVTDIGAFHELPSDVAWKISNGETEEEELTQALRELIANPGYRNTLGKKGLAYAKEHLEIESTAENLTEFLKEAVQFNTIKDNEMYRTLRDRTAITCRELGRTDHILLGRVAKSLAEIFHMGETMKNAK